MLIGGRIGVVVCPAGSKRYRMEIIEYEKKIGNYGFSPSYLFWFYRSEC